MEKEIETAFIKVHESIDKLATSVATSFHALSEKMDQRFDQVDQRLGLLESEVRELRNETRSIRAALERLPDDIDATYAPTMNDMLERIIVIEKKLGIAA
jgi:DNA-binding ferritin-like protein